MRTILRQYYAAELPTARRGKVGAMLVHAGVAATVGLASAVSGAAVALHLAPVPPAGPSVVRAVTARTEVSAAPVEKPVVFAEALQSTVQPRTAGSSAAMTESSARSPAALPAPASAPIPERQLTFAWGYAQRHFGAAARPPEAPVGLAGARAVGAVIAPKRARTAERPRASGAQRETVGSASPESFFAFGGARHQASGYGDQRRANASGMWSRPPLSAQRATVAQPSFATTTNPGADLCLPCR